MSKKTWDEPIDKTVDWGGDASTQNLPVQGNRVQEFLKKGLESKIGYIVRDEKTNYYYCFADSVNATKYYKDPEHQADLLLAMFDAPITKMVNLKLLSPSSNVLIKGAVNNIVKVEFETLNIEEVPISENHTITYTITRSGYKKTITQTKTATEKVAELNIDEYLDLGISNVSILVTGNDTKASSTVSAIYNCVNLKVTDTLNIATPNTDTLHIPFTIEGTAGVPKTMYWYVNGDKQPTVETDVFTQASASSSKSFPISSLQQGVHNIQFRAGMTVEGVEFYTPTYFRDFIVDKGVASAPMITLSNEIPTGYEPLTGDTYKNPTIYGLSQYITSNLKFGVYNKGISYTNASICLNDELIKVSITENEKENIETVTPTITGASVISISAQNSIGTATTSANATVSKSEMDFSEDNDNLRLNLRALGKNNQSDKNKWEFNSVLDGKTYKTTFNNFSWNNNSGWYDNSLIIGEGTSIDVDITPLKTIKGKDVKDNGFTFEMEFSTANVINDDAVICDLTAEDGNGILITATGIKLSAHAKGVEVTSKFKSGENIRVAFVINKYVTSSDNFAYLYVNGVLCGAFSYGDAAFIVDKGLHIDGSNGAVVKLKQIRIYNKTLTAQEIVNNYILYRENGVDMMNLYRKNKIYDGGTISVDAVQENLPVFIITGDLQKLENFTPEDKGTIVVMPEVKFINTLDPKTSFRVVNAHMSCQGTSSMAYPLKNFRLYTKKKSKKESDPTPVVYDLDGNVISSKISFKSCENGTPYEGDKLPQAVNAWCIKADYAESSSSHNTGVARIWNKVLSNVVVDNTRVCATRAQREAENASYKYDVRTTVDGYPCVIFARQTENDPLVYMGKYNFNNDKSTESVFGFCDIPGVDYISYEYEDSTLEEYDSAPDTDKNETEWKGYKKDIPEDWSTVCPKAYEFSKTYQKVKTIILDEEAWNNNYYFKKKLTSESIENKVYCVEMNNNDSKLGMFDGKPEDFVKWADAFEFRYPEGENDIDTNGGLTHLEVFFNWCCSTRHANDTEYGENITISGEVKTDDDIMYHNSDKYAPNGVYEDNAENRQKKFQREKWDHLDVYKMAAYYVYLMRFGAVDQVVKNAMFTTEGTRAWAYDKVQKKCVEKTGTHCKWFYINYDNDTILGLNNAGQLVFGPDIDRQSNVGGIYSYAGHNSTLWNNLEADAEFMAIVRSVDNGLAKYGLDYMSMIEMFDDNQATKWCERLLNNDAQIKYLDTFKKQNNLGMLQGPRSSHRKWWISKRFALYDSKFISGDYAKQYILFRSNGGTGVGTKFYITPSERMYYGYGDIDMPIVTGVEGLPGSAITFETKSDYQIGSQLRIYAGPYITKVDISNLEHVIITGSTGVTVGELDTFDLSEAYSETLGSQLREVILGKTGTTNITLKRISGLRYAPNLEYLNVIGYSGLSSLDLSENAYIKELNASNSGLANLTLPNGTIIEKLYLPDIISELKLIGAPNITKDNICFDNEIESYKSINTIDIENCQYLMGNDSYNMVMTWLNNKSEGSYDQCRLVLDGINWTRFTMNDVDKLLNFKSKCPNVTIKGTVDMANRIQGTTIEETLTNINKVKQLFGENCFSSDNEVYVKIQTIIVLKTPKTQIVAGQENQFSYDIYPYLPATAAITYSIENGSREGVTINSITGKLTSTENIVGSDSNFTIRVTCTQQGVLIPSTSEISFKVLDPTYPTHGVINGPKGLYRNNTYQYNLNIFTNKEMEPIGTYTVDWALTGDGVTYVSSWSGEGKNVSITMGEEQPEPYAEMNLSAIVTPFIGGPFTVTYDLLSLHDEVIMTTYTNPVVMELAFEEGWATFENVMTKTEALNIIDFNTAFTKCTSTEFTFDEIKYFTNVTDLKDNAFYGSKLKNITLPDNIQTIGKYAFADCKVLENVVLDKYSGTTIPEGCFMGDEKMKFIEIPNSVTIIENYSFGGTAIKHISDEKDENDGEKLLIPSSLSQILDKAFSYRDSYIGGNANNLVTIKIVSGMTLCGDGVIRGQYITDYFIDSNNVTYGTDGYALYDKSFVALLKYPSAKVGDSYVCQSSCTNILPYAFSNTKLKEVKIDGTVTLMGDYCFYNNNTLEKIDLSLCSNLDKLPNYCFANNSALLEIIFPDQSNINTIGFRGFSYCTAIKDLTIPDSVTTIESDPNKKDSRDTYLLDNCISLTSLTLSDAITGINRYIISKCSSLESVKLPKHIQLGTNAYSVINACNSLKIITLPIMDDQYYSILSINDCPSLLEFKLNENDEQHNYSVFDGCLYNNTKAALIKVPFGKQSINYSNNIKSIGQNAFENCQRFEDIEIPSTITYIGIQAFSKSSIKTAKIPEGISIIESSTFNSCSGLRSVILPTTITTIDTLAFANTNNLSSVTAYMVSAPEKESEYSPFDKTGQSVIGDKKLYIPFNSIGYTTKKPWSTPLLDPEKCNFTAETIVHDIKTIHITIKEGETIYTAGTPYIGTVPGTLKEDNSFKFELTYVKENETLDILESDGGSKIAEVTIKYNLNRYIVDKLNVLLFTTKSINDRVVSKVEYDLLNAKVKQLEAKLEKILQKE